MAAPVLTHTGERLYGALAPLATEDATYDYALAKFSSALVRVIDELADLSRDGDDGSLGYSTLFNPDTCPARYLPFLAQFVGVGLRGDETEEEMRLAIRDTRGMKRGTPSAIIEAVRPLLTGGQTVLLIERWGDADHFRVVTLIDETPDPAAVVRRLAEHEIGGLIGTHAVVTGGDFNSLRDTHADFAQIVTDYRDFDEVRIAPTKRPIWHYGEAAAEVASYADLANDYVDYVDLKTPTT